MSLQDLFFSDEFDYLQHINEIEDDPEYLTDSELATIFHEMESEEISLLSEAYIYLAIASGVA
jgi:hypothetical protein